MTELNEWLGRGLAQDYDIVWLPLNKDLRATKNLSEPSLLSWFNLMEHSAHSPVVSFLAAFDTPDESMPAPLNAESLPINLRLYNKMKNKTYAMIAERQLEILLEALHKRTESLLVTDELK